MVFKSRQKSPSAMFTFGKRRCRCTKGLFDTAGQPDEKDLVEFLKTNPNFEELKGEAPKGDDLDKLTIEELLEIALEEKVDAPSTLERIKSPETMAKRIRESREK